MTETVRTKYDGVAMLLHWVTALLIVFMLVFGEDLMEAAEEFEEAGEAGEALAGTFLPSVHVSIGVAILVLTLLRVLWRITHSAPPLPVTMKSWEVMLSKLTHAAFYALLIGFPSPAGWPSEISCGKNPQWQPSRCSAYSHFQPPPVWARPRRRSTKSAATR